MFPSSSTFQLSLLSCKSIFLHFFGCHIGSVWEIFSFFYDKSFFNRVNYECIKGVFNIIRPENLARDTLIINETNQIIFTRQTNVETILWQIWMVLFCLKSLSYLVADDKDLCFLRCIFSQEYDVWPIFRKIFTHLFCHTMNLSSQRNQQKSYNEITNLWVLMCCSFVFGVRINQKQPDRIKGRHEIHEKNMIVIIEFWVAQIMWFALKPPKVSLKEYVSSAENGWARINCRCLEIWLSRHKCVR